MPRKKLDQSALYNKMIVEGQIKEEYAQFLKEENMEKSPHSAHVFAIRKVGGWYNYKGLKERDLILLLAGELPYMYD